MVADPVGAAATGTAPWSEVSSDEALRAAMQSAAVGMSLCTPDGRFLEVNPALARLFARDAAALMAMTWQELTHPGDLEADLDLVGQVLDGDRDSFRLVKRFLRPDGTIVWGDLNVGCVRDDRGGVRFFVAQVVDVTDAVLAKEELRLSARRWRAALEAFREPFFTFSPVRDAAGHVIDMTYTYLNKAGEDLIGQPATAVVGYRLLELFPSSELTGTLAHFAEPLVTGQPSRTIVRGFDERGVSGSFELSSYPFGGEVIVMAREISHQVSVEGAIRDSETRYRLLAENALDLVFSLDMKAVIQWVSPSATALLGYEPDELVGQFGGMLIHPEDLPLLLEAAGRARTGTPASCRIRMVLKPGGRRWVEATPRPLYDDEGELSGGVIGVRDIHEEVEARQALEREIATDALTGLGKRSLALERIQEILDTRTAPGWALLCVGIDGMTAVNQAYTYAAGDTVLTAVAERLVAAAGVIDRVARIAGDEFVVLMRDIVTPTDAANAAVHILQVVQGPVDIDHTSIDVTACVGIALSNGQPAQDLMRDATAAMRQASAKGNNRWEFLDGNVQEETREVLRVQGNLREAIHDGRIRPWLMPIVDLDDGSTVGYEALVRWILDDGTMIGPDDFMGVAERTGLVLAMDRVVLSSTLALMGDLAPDQHVAVNVSAATLSSGTLDEWVRGELDRTRVDPRRLHLEVTETSLFRVSESVQETMQSLASIGISWWVDDFGTGFSSISHLRDLPIAGLKLDQTFTAGVTSRDSHANRLALGLVGLANGLGLQTIAEGVETPEQARVLTRQGWQMGQGWLFGKPAPHVPPA